MALGQLHFLSLGLCPVKWGQRGCGAIARVAGAQAWLSPSTCPPPTVLFPLGSAQARLDQDPSPRHLGPLHCFYSPHCCFSHTNNQFSNSQDTMIQFNSGKTRISGTSYSTENIDHALLTRIALFCLKKEVLPWLEVVCPPNLSVNLGMEFILIQDLPALTERLTTLLPKQWLLTSACKAYLPKPAIPTSPWNPCPTIQAAGLWGLQGRFLWMTCCCPRLPAVLE